MPGLSRKETARLLVHLEAQGVGITDVKNGVMLRLPNGESTVVHYSVSDARGPMKLRAQLKRAGLTWPTDPSGHKGGQPKGTPTPRAREVATAAMEALGHPDRVKAAQVREQFAANGWPDPTNGTVRRAMMWLGYEPVGQTAALVWVKPTPIVDPPVAAPIPIRPPEPEPEPGPGHPDYMGHVPDTSSQSREFLDTAESWTLDLVHLPAGVTLDALAAFMNAAGLDMEVRVWKR